MSDKSDINKRCKSTTKVIRNYTKAHSTDEWPGSKNMFSNELKNRKNCKQLYISEISRIEYLVYFANTEYHCEALLQGEIFYITLFLDSNLPRLFIWNVTIHKTDLSFVPKYNNNNKWNVHFPSNSLDM